MKKYFVLTALIQFYLFLLTYNALKNKPDRNEGENAGYKLVRMLMEQPHIPDTDLQKIS